MCAWVFSESEIAVVRFNPNESNGKKLRIFHIPSSTIKQPIGTPHKAHWRDYSEFGGAFLTALARTSSLCLGVKL